MGLRYAITLQMSNYELSEDYPVNNIPLSEPYLLELINTWLRNQSAAPLRLLGNLPYLSRTVPLSLNHYVEPPPTQYGGTIRPYIQLAAGGYHNFLDLNVDLQNEFYEFVVALPWRYPEVVVLLVTIDGEPSEVYRPSRYDSWDEMEAESLPLTGE